LNIDKAKDFSEWYNTITKEAELCDLRYHVKGFVVFMPWSVMAMKRMYAMYEQVLERNGHVPAWFPALIPESFLMKEKEHVEGFAPEVFWVTKAGLNDLEERLAMRPTSETAIYSMYSLWIHGLKDLPLKIYHSSQVWRYETKATKPFIRSREFHWIEAHDVFATEADAMAQVRQDMEMAEEVIHQKFGIPFLFFRRPQWDKFAGAVDTFAADTLLPDRRTLQLPSTHMLGQNFAKSFNVKYTDAKGEEQFCWQTTYGPAISRIYAALIATHGDERGLVLPFELAPVQVVIVPIVKAENREKVMGKCKGVEKQLVSASLRVKLDDSENSPGFKYNQWEMKGVPIRIEIGERDMESGTAMVVHRDTKEKTKIKFDSLESEILKTPAGMLANLVSKADEWFKAQLASATTMDELAKSLDSHGFVRVPFCTDQKQGEKCADAVKEKTHANMRGSLFDSKEVPKGEKCVACGKKAEIYLYAARQY
jgi:prolyl-tRNA synthetase